MIVNTKGGYTVVQMDVMRPPGLLVSHHVKNKVMPSKCHCRNQKITTLIHGPSLKKKQLQNIKI